MSRAARSSGDGPGTASRNILLLGAGLVAPPLVHYLLDHAGFRVTIAATDFVPQLASLPENSRLRRVPLDARDEDQLGRLVAGADGVVSLLPSRFHGAPARACISHRRPLVTTSYIGDEIAALDSHARESGVALLMECGFHPGLNHMLAKRVIDGARAKGERIATYDSLAAGLPAPDSNDNPWGYKFSWSPDGVLAAAMEPATMLIDGEEIHVPGGEIFRHPLDVEVPRLGTLEAYPNRSALMYRELYDIPEVRTMRRCTLRYPGHCATWDAMIRLGLLREAPLAKGVTTTGGLVRELAGRPHPDARSAAAAALGLDRGAEPLERFEWLGLFADAPLPPDTGSPRDALLGLMKARLAFSEGERDIVILHDRFELETPGGERVAHDATLVDTGRAGTGSAMARMVALPAAIAIERLVSGRIGATGVAIPVEAPLYQPILDGLAQLGVRLDETH